MREVVASAPGKINLALYVGAPESDGYHPLVTVFEALNLRETVCVRTRRTPGIAVTTTAYRPDGTVDAATTQAMRELDPRTHLAYRAARTLQKLAASGPWAATAAGLDIAVDKRVPIAGGMAGGSADAAATLVACNALWGLGLDAVRLELIGRTLGADVPACLAGGIALGTGRGDTVESIDQGRDVPGHEGKEPRHYWVIARAHEGLATPEVFRALDRAGGPLGQWRDLPDPAVIRSLPFTGSAEELAPHLCNDLHDAAVSLRPELSSTIAAAREAGARAVLLSGSGPTIGALASDAHHADALAAALATCDSVAEAFTTFGPVPGARLESGDPH